MGDETAMGDRRNQTMKSIEKPSVVFGTHTTYYKRTCQVCGEHRECRAFRHLGPVWAGAFVCDQCLADSLYLLMENSDKPINGKHANWSCSDHFGSEIDHLHRGLRNFFASVTKAKGAAKYLGWEARWSWFNPPWD